MDQLKNCRCLALAILIVVGWHAESQASAEVAHVGTALLIPQGVTGPIGNGTVEVKGALPYE